MVIYINETLERAIEFTNDINDIANNNEGIAPREEIENKIGSIRSRNISYKYSTAKQFGLIESHFEGITLTLTVTPLGKQLIKPNPPKNKRIEALLMSNDYFKLLRRYNGKYIPKKKVLKNFFEEIGVSENFSEKAAESFRKNVRWAKVVENGKIIIPEKFFEKDEEKISNSQEEEEFIKEKNEFLIYNINAEKNKIVLTIEFDLSEPIEPIIVQIPRVIPEEKEHAVLKRINFFIKSHM